MKILTSENTPCEVLFNTMKKRLGLPHKELASYLLSNRPLSDGRSPLEHAKDRTWLSHVIVHAPVGAQQERYFGDFGLAAERIMGRLRSNKGREAGDVLKVLRGQPSRDMQDALALCHQDPNLYRNALERLLLQEGLATEELALDALVLFVAAGCSASSGRAVEYLAEYQKDSRDVQMTTPATCELGGAPLGSGAPTPRPTVLGLVRVRNGCVQGDIHWAAPLDDDGQKGRLGFVVGSLATGDGSVTDVEPDVSARHALLWRGDDQKWLVDDLGSTNGTYLLSALGGGESEVTPGKPREVGAGDELRVGGDTRFVVVQGSM